MSRPRPTSIPDIVKLLLMGLGLIIAASKDVLPKYSHHDGSITPAWVLLFTFLLVTPACFLGYIRKNIAVRGGDWRILVLFWVLTAGLIFTLSLPSFR